MTDRKQALTDLLVKVEVGGDIFPNDFPSGFKKVPRAIGAFEGSLDAAKALHEEVLPEWSWQKMPDGTIHMMHEITFDTSSGHYNDNPARAWLIAIIKAIIAEEETHD